MDIRFLKAPNYVLIGFTLLLEKLVFVASRPKLSVIANQSA